ncbi:hypothetical protein GCM10027176_19130 [Actinoallomurus bryophytorum]|uniref:Alpha/beta hydrolase family protein n=1 Tax=Actinoallomurus bryophytorum TaxID=1490222 RepID=A0A543CLB9_9ACTN|nr:hypothetical protein [Actinoallomurus bryophytorum]TQL97810.1 hypothetical protein FB559_3416 [Actinoallomurus bryophytorum]
MTPGTLVLLHSPLSTASAWGALPAALGPYDVVVPEVTDDDRPPYGPRYVARAALEITAAGVRPPVVLVAHGDAGPLLPAIGAAQRAAHRLVGGYVFVDAVLPGPAGDRRGYSEGEVPAGVTVRARDAGYFAEEPPMPQDWPDAPCGYLRTSTRHEDQAKQARMRGWAVADHPVGHFAAVRDPEGTAEALRTLMSAL